MAAYNKMYRFNHEFHNDSKGIEYKNFLGRNKVRRGAESVDDVIAECAGLRTLAGGLREAVKKMDMDRRTGKAWDSSAGRRIQEQIKNSMYRLEESVEKVLECN